MTRLEERYRRVLRPLPASYREVWEEDMVATFRASVHTDDPDDADYEFSVWTPALAVLAFAVLGLRLATLLDYARFGSAGWHPATVVLGIAEAVAVTAAAVTLTLLSSRALRRLPATADAAAWSTPTR